MNKQEYSKYRWFFTSNNNLVIGGKSAEQNEKLVKMIMKDKENYVVMHTRMPGSPFAIILSEIVDAHDLEEVAIWTGCFSRAWREGKRKAMIDVFTKNQIGKKKNMKSGTFGVRGDVKNKEVVLRLVLVKQKKKLRAVPTKTVKKKDVLMKLIPGKTSKQKAGEIISEKLGVGVEEVLNALPTGGFSLRNG